LPITTGQAVLGKFLAAWVFLFISLLMTTPIYFTLVVLGRPEFGPVFTGYFGALLLGGAYLAISGFFSVITKSQVISFVLGLIACVAFLLLGQPFILGFLDANFPAFVSEIFESLSASAQFDKMQRGMIEVQSLLFMLVLTVGFLFASSVMLDERKAA
jgi:ABC-2 type transport system permease protein